MLAKERLDNMQPTPPALDTGASASVSRRRMRITLSAAVIVAVLAASLAWWNWREHNARIGVWQQVWSRDFTAPGADPSCLRSAVMTGRFAGVEGMGVDGVLLHAWNLLWLEDVTERGDVRLTAEVIWPDAVDGLELHVNARRSGAIDKVETPPGFSCTVGGSLGVRTYISVTWPGERNQPTRLACPELQPGRPYRVTLTHAEGRITVAIDGTVILDQEELLPPRGPEYSSFAIRPSTDVLLRSLSIERLGLPARPSPLLAGDVLIAGDNPAQAVAVFQQVADDHPKGSLAEEALARAVLAACKSSDVEAWKEPLARLGREFPGSRLMQPCLETVALRHWTRGDLAQALDIADGLLKDHADSQVAPLLLHRRLYSMPGGDEITASQVIPPASLERLIGLLHRTRNLEYIDLANLAISDLSGLRGLQLRYLNAQSNPLSDLAPLAGMPLIELNASYTKVRSLEPLRGMPLQVLRMEEAPIDDAAAVCGMPLRSLRIGSAPAFDPSQLKDIAPIDLALYHVPMSELPAIDYTRMVVLNIQRTEVMDISRLRSARKLINVNLEYTKVADVSPLREAPLQWLSTSRTRITELSSLAGARLRWYDADDSPLMEVKSLAGMPLRTLRLNGTLVTDLSTLDVSALDWLTLDRSLVTDLSPLRGSPLRGLSIVRTAITDLDPILTMPQLRNLKFTLGKDQTQFWDALIKRLQTAGRLELARSISHALAWEIGDPVRMKSLAEAHQGRLRFDSQTRMDIAKARALAAQFGARLPCLTGTEDEARLLSLLGPAWTSCWLGVTADGKGGLVWDDGTAVAWNRVPPLMPILADTAWFMASNRHGFIWSQVPATSSHSRCNLVLEWDQAP